MEKNGTNGGTSVPRPPIDWDNDEALAIDGFTVGEIKAFVHAGAVEARCAVCEAIHTIEPDAQDYRCPSCGHHAALTSPLVKLGLI